MSLNPNLFGRFALKQAVRHPNTNTEHIGRRRYELPYRFFLLAWKKPGAISTLAIGIGNGPLGLRNPYREAVPGPRRMVDWDFIEFEEVGSTQTVAMKLAADGAPEGTAVVARSQSSGTGRLGRKWISPLGGLYLSFILRPIGLRRPELAAFVAAAAVAQGVREASGLEPAIRWPNDIMIGGKKLGGVIAQAQSSGAEIDLIVVGIGINCDVPISVSSGVPDATSLTEQLGRDVEISLVRNAVLESFSRLYQKWQQGESMTPLWTSRLSTVGKAVLVKLKTDETPFSARATRVDDDGTLVIEHGGKTRDVTPEDLEWLRELP